MMVAIIRLIQKKYLKEIFTAPPVVTEATANIALIYICDQSDNCHCLAKTCS